MQTQQDALFGAINSLLYPDNKQSWEKTKKRSDMKENQLKVDKNKSWDISIGLNTFIQNSNIF